MRQVQKSELAKPFVLKFRRIMALFIAMILLMGSTVYTSSDSVEQVSVGYSPDYSSSNSEDNLSDPQDNNGEGSYEEIYGNGNEPEDQLDEEELEELEEEEEEELEEKLPPIIGIMQFSSSVGDFPQLQAEIADPSVSEIVITASFGLDSVLSINRPIHISGDFGTETLTAVAGGGFIVANGGNLTLEGITIQGDAVAGTGVTVNAGGTLTMFDDAAVKEFTNSGVVVNGIFIMMGGTVAENSNNTATPALNGGGGGVRVNNGGVFNMSGGQIVENSITGTGVGHSGGGVRVNSGGTFTMTGGLLADNTTHGGSNHGAGVDLNGGTFNMSGDGTLIQGNVTNMNNANGGGVAVRNGAHFTMTGGTISGNEAGNQAGGVFVTGSTSIFDMNGGLIYDNTAAIHGGGVFLIDGSTLNMRNDATIEENMANGGQGGGGVHVAAAGGPAFNMFNGTIIGNRAPNPSGGDGGGISVTGTNSRLNITGGSITDNTASGNGGGIFVTGAIHTFVVSNADIKDNTAGNAQNASTGGGIAIVNGGTNAAITNSNISGNDATQHGGGISVAGNGAGVTINGSTIEDNDAEGNGGGIALLSLNITLNIFDSNIVENTADGNGGGISIAGGGSIVGVNNTILDDNGAVGNGGGIWQNAGALSVLNSEIINNTANGNGGGIFTTNYTNLTVNPTMFSGNSAATAHDFSQSSGFTLGGLVAPATNGGIGGSTANIQWASVSIFGTHALNNFDINYTGYPVGLGSITITVEDTSSDPIEDAVVRLYVDDNGTWILVYQGYTDEYGVIEFPNLLDGEYRVLVSKTGYVSSAPQYVDIENGNDETINVVLLEPTVFVPEVTITKDAPLTIIAGEPLTYYITVENTGNTTLTNLQVTDVLPLHLLPPASADVVLPSGVTGGFTGRTLTATIASLAPNASVIIEFTTYVVAATAVGTPIENSASVVYLNDITVNGSDSVTTTVVEAANPDVTITKAVSAPVTAGGTLTYILTVQNTGNVTLEDLLVTDNLPVQLQSPRNTVLPNGASGGFIGLGLNVVIPSLVPNATATIMFDVTVAPDMLGGMTITNTATVIGWSNPYVSDEDSVTTMVQHPGGNNNGGNGSNSFDPGPDRDNIPGSIIITKEDSEQSPSMELSAIDVEVDDSQQVVVIEVAEPIVYGLVAYEPLTVDFEEDNERMASEARPNPFTGDDRNVFGLIASIIGLIVSIGAMIIVIIRYKNGKREQ